MTGDDGFGYAECVLIADPKLLVHRLIHRCRFRGKPLTETFQIKCEAINYTDQISLDPLRTPLQPDIFRKSLRYQNQLEHGIALIPFDQFTPDLDQDAEFVNVDPCGLLRIVNLDINEDDAIVPSMSTYQAKSLI
jgi:hypothetical protein